MRMGIRFSIPPEWGNRPEIRLFGLIGGAFALVILWGALIWIMAADLPMFVQTRCPHWKEANGKVISLVPADIHPGIRPFVGKSFLLVEYRTEDNEIRQIQGVFADSNYSVGAEKVVRYNEKKAVLASENEYYMLKFIIYGVAAVLLLPFTIFWIFKLRIHIREQKYSY